MPSVNIDIAPPMLQWIISQKQIETINTELMTKLEKWKSGIEKPTFSQIEKISKAANIPLGYFFLQTPPAEDLSLLDYRTVDSISIQNPSRNLIDVINEMEDVQEWMRDYLIKNDTSKLAFVGEYKNSTEINEIVESIRYSLNLKEDWFNEVTDERDAFKKLRVRLEACGVIIMAGGYVGQNNRKKIDIEEFRAFTLIDEYAPLIFINTNDSKGGRLFSLLHEVAHIWLGRDNFFNDRNNVIHSVSKEETICNAVAAELLVPNRIFNQKWKSHERDTNYFDKILSVAQEFKCGITVIARRALDNGLIGIDKYNEVAGYAKQKYKEQQEKQKESSKGSGNFYNNLSYRLDNRFISALNNSIYEGTTTFTEAYRLTNTTRKTFSTLVDKIRGSNNE